MFFTDFVGKPTSREFTDEGYMIVDAKISRVGIQTYYVGEFTRDELPAYLRDKPDYHPVRALRPPEEVFADESLESIANKPVTNLHPPVAVDASNYKAFAVGNVISKPAALEDGIHVGARLMVTDAQALADVKAGREEISVGYSALLDWTQGDDPRFGAFDVIQRQITGNHVALVNEGRAGAAVRIADQKSGLSSAAVGVGQHVISNIINVR